MASNLTINMQTQESANEGLRYCDLVMKGGITSGVIYPSAAVELSKVYQFRNIGGTSAGAIAAALTTAAEYGRQSGSSSGFTKLSEIPSWLRKDNNLLSLFRPDPPTRSLFLLLSALAGRSGESTAQRILSALWIGIIGFPIAGAALLPTLTIAVVAFVWAADSSRSWLLAAAVCLFVLGAIVTIVLIAILVFRRLMIVLPQNLLGLCTGMAVAPAGETPTLTNWLSKTLDETAGVETDDPLTFGKLWGDRAVQAFRQALISSNQDGAPDYDPTTDEDRIVNLAMISSNITFGRPFTLPFDLHGLFFDPVEFRRLFPERVVAWMEAHPRTPPNDRDREIDLKMIALGKRPLPDAADLPVVVATRMSLSFPLLISAVPLWAIDWTRKENAIPKGSDRSPVPEHCWFSDGGLASNFPIHFFDSPLPRWPTFAIDLASFPPDYPYKVDQPEGDRVWMPTSNEGSIADVWDRIDDPERTPSLRGFIGALLDTMQNWSDNSLSHAPGYRDRIVHVYLRPVEGGLNLRMDPDILKSLSERGACAGQRLIEHFASAPPPKMSWDNHRWIRYRSFMAATERLLKQFQTGYSQPLAPDRRYLDLVSREAGNPPLSYPWAGTQQTAASAANAALVSLATQFAGADLAAGAPRPSPDLHMRPRA